MEWIHLDQYKDHCNELSVSLKGGEFLDHMRHY
jgi:hypothetical protein